VRLRKLHGDVRAGISRPDDQHFASLQLRGILVLMRMQLHDPVVEFARERRHPWRLVVRHRHDDLVRFKRLFSGIDVKPLVGTPQFLNLHAIADGQTEPV
jgi:hypothetical protein